MHGSAGRTIRDRGRDRRTRQYARCRLPDHHAFATGTPSALAIRVLHRCAPRSGGVRQRGNPRRRDHRATAVIQRLAQELDPQALAGTLLLVPVANIFGFMTRSRYLPDRRDLNRSFPRQRQWLAPRRGSWPISSTAKVVERCNAQAIDIHTGRDPPLQPAADPHRGRPTRGWSNSPWPSVRR